MAVTIDHGALDGGAKNYDIQIRIIDDLPDDTGFFCSCPVGVLRRRQDLHDVQRPFDVQYVYALFALVESFAWSFE